MVLGIAADAGYSKVPVPESAVLTGVGEGHGIAYAKAVQVTNRCNGVWYYFDGIRIAFRAPVLGYGKCYELKTAGKKGNTCRVLLRGGSGYGVGAKVPLEGGIAGKCSAGRKGEGVVVKALFLRGDKRWVQLGIYLKH